MTDSRSDRATSRTVFLYTCAAAVLSWATVSLQLWLSIRQGRQTGIGAGGGVWIYVAFFTIWTNLLVAITLTAPLLVAAAAAGRFFTRASVITAVAANIILVGVSYNLLLRTTWNPQGLNLVADILLHDVVPTVFLIYWWLTASRRAIGYASISLWTLYPIVYFSYALARGAATGFYPYPFIDVTNLGYVHVLVNALGILFGFVLVAVLLVTIGRLRARHDKRFPAGDTN